MVRHPMVIRAGTMEAAHPPILHRHRDLINRLRTESRKPRDQLAIAQKTIRELNKVSQNLKEQLAKAVEENEQTTALNDELWSDNRRLKIEFDDAVNVNQQIGN